LHADRDSRTRLPLDVSQIPADDSEKPFSEKLSPTWHEPWTRPTVVNAKVSVSRSPSSWPTLRNLLSRLTRVLSSPPFVQLSSTATLMFDQPPLKLSTLLNKSLVLDRSTRLFLPFSTPFKLPETRPMLLSKLSER
jgi:hypothetical protein